MLMHKWKEDQLRACIAVCYAGTANGMDTAAVVIHYPERLVPRRLLREQRKLHKQGWHDYQWWGFAWTDEAWARVVMGDAPEDIVQAFNPRDLESDARAEAREWVGPEARDVPYFDLPQPARQALRYAIFRGPGSFHF